MYAILMWRCETVTSVTVSLGRSKSSNRAHNTNRLALRLHASCLEATQDPALLASAYPGTSRPSHLHDTVAAGERRHKRISCSVPSFSSSPIQPPPPSPSPFALLLLLCSFTSDRQGSLGPVSFLLQPSDSHHEGRMPRRPGGSCVSITRHQHRHHPQRSRSGARFDKRKAHSKLVYHKIQGPRPARGCCRPSCLG